MNKWAWVGFAAMVALFSSLSATSNKYLQVQHPTQHGSMVLLGLSCAGILAACLLCTKTTSHDEIRRMTPQSWGAVVVMATASILNWILFARALESGPSPGAVQAIVNCNVVLSTLLSAWLFGLKMNAQSWAGIFLVAVGGSLLVLAKPQPS